MTSEAYAGVTALVLGASGFIGSWTVRRLCLAGAVVHAAGRDPDRLADALRRTGSTAHEAIADVTRPGVVVGLVRRVQPSIVFNLAVYGVDHAERDSGLMARVNHQAVVELCSSLGDSARGRWRGMRLVQAGSALEYGRVEGILTESMTPNPTTPYGLTKLAATDHVQRLAQSGGLEAVVARLFTVYGPGEHPDRLLPSLIRFAGESGALPLTHGTQSRDFTYVDDAVEGLLRLGATATASGEVLNVATGRLATVREFVETAADVLQIDSSRLAFGAKAHQAEEMFHGSVDVSRLAARLSWTPQTSIRDGIRRTLEHQ